MSFSILLDSAVVIMPDSLLKPVTALHRTLLAKDKQEKDVGEETQQRIPKH